MSIDFASALEAAQAIRRKRVSSEELTRRAFERIDHYDPQINSFVYKLREEALARARRLDRSLAKGKRLGVFHGVPVNIKESFGVAGQPCTWGIPAFKDAKAGQNSEAADRLLEAGAVLIGGTNVPVNLGDIQSYNKIYGTTNNPWDLTRTPGGSSGGSAAALAAGLGYLSVGSDIGGSLRSPAHCCGIYAHKPTLDLVSLRGHLPGGALQTPGFTTLLAAAGPMARSAEDLLAALKVLGGPIGCDAKAWRWKMPAPRARTLKEYRVGYVLDDPNAPVTPEMKPLLEQTITALGRAGAQLKPGWPPGYDHGKLLANYLFMLRAFLFSVVPQARQNQNAIGEPGLASFAEWQRQNLMRLAFRAQWQAYFQDVDVFLSPVMFTPAFPHDHSEPMDQRTIATSAGPAPYWNIFHWIAPATLTGCPATAAPIGLTASGLPSDIQIMGPLWEDAMPITFAALMAREIGGFLPPAGYAD
jgi:amidase